MMVYTGTPLRYIAMAANKQREWSPMRFELRPRPLKLTLEIKPWSIHKALAESK